MFVLTQTYKSVYAQDPIKPTVSTTTNAVSVPTTSPIGYINNSSIGLSFIQSASENWFDGDNNAFTLKLLLRLLDKSTVGDFVFVNRGNLKIGVQYLRSSSSAYPLRATDNECSVESVGVLKLNWTIDPYISLSSKTSVTEIFDYDDEFNDRYRIGKFLDPFSIKQSAGLRYSNITEDYDLDTRAGLFTEERFAESHTYFTDDTATSEVEKFAIRSGIEAITDLNASITDNVNYTGKIELSSQFKNLDEWKIKFENEFRAKIWRFVNVALNVNLVYNLEQNIKTQWQESLSLGIVQNF